MSTAAAQPPRGYYGPNLRHETPIYRIYPLKFLEELLNGRFVVRSTRTWTDPYENLPLRSCLETIENGRIKQHFIEKNWLPTLGQCWSTLKESDAMWRIYSTVDQARDNLDAAFGSHEAVRLETTAGKLLNAIVDSFGPEKGESCFIARVKYLDEKALTQEVANIIGSQREEAFGGSKGNAEAHLRKRDAFAHENEVRLLYVDVEKEFENGEQVSLTIDPNQVVDEITFDPRILAGTQEVWRTNWIRDHGFKNRVNRSLLYLGVGLIVPTFTEDDLKTQQPSELR